MRCLLSLIAVAGLALCAAADAPKLPEPPSGFQWQWCEEIRAAFLRPDGWYFKQGKQKETIGVFITKEKIEGDTAKFRTGLTVNVIPGVGKKSGGKASDYAFNYVRLATTEKQNVISLQEPTDRGRVKTCGYRIRKDGTIVHALLIADDVADKLYLVMFESPEAEFDDAWQTGQTIMKKLYFEFPK